MGDGEYCYCKHRHDSHINKKIDPPYYKVYYFIKSGGAIMRRPIRDMLMECRECDCKLFVGAPDSIIFPEYVKQFQ